MSTVSTAVINTSLNYSAKYTSKGSVCHVTPISSEVSVVISQTGADLNLIKLDIESVLSLIYASTFIAASDAYLPYMLSPKNGMSIQEAILWAKSQYAYLEEGYIVLGREVPSLTVNSLIVTVTAEEPTLEYLAKCLFAKVTETLKEYNLTVYALRIKTPTYSVTESLDESLDSAAQLTLF